MGSKAELRDSEQSALSRLQSHIKSLDDRESARQRPSSVPSSKPVRKAAAGKAAKGKENGKTSAGPLVPSPAKRPLAASSLPKPSTGRPSLASTAAFGLPAQGALDLGGVGRVKRSLDSISGGVLPLPIEDALARLEASERSQVDSLAAALRQCGALNAEKNRRRAEAVVEGAQAALEKQNGLTAAAITANYEQLPERRKAAVAEYTQVRAQVRSVQESHAQLEASRPALQQRLAREMSGLAAKEAECIRALEEKNRSIAAELDAAWAAIDAEKAEKLIKSKKSRNSTFSQLKNMIDSGAF